MSITKKQLIEALAEYPDNQEIVLFDGEQTVELEDYVAECTETKNAVIYIK